MRVLLCAPNDQHSGLYLRRALEQLNHSVEEFDYRNQVYPPPNVKLLETERETKPDLTLILKGEVFTPETLKRIYPCVLFNFDLWYNDAPWLREQVKAVDHFLTPSIGVFQGGHWMVEAADPELHKPMLPDPHIAADVCFIGTVADIPGRDEWLAKIGKWCDANGKTLRIYGSFPGPLSRKWHTGQRAARADGSGEDEVHNLIVSSSKIILDRQRNPEIDGVISARVFRVAAAGGFVLMRRSKGLERLFVDEWSGNGREVGSYDDDHECLEAIAYYLEHGELRKGIAARGRKRVLKDHTWKVRAEQILKLVKL